MRRHLARIALTFPSMENTVSLLAKVLGAKGLESSAAGTRFVAESPEGGRLKVSIAGGTQRFMATLVDATGVTRCSIDVAPVTKVREDPSYPGRVTLHVGTTLVVIDSQPSLAIELGSLDG
jgi:hypothetical protein